MTEKKSVLVICNSSAGRMYLGVLMNRIWYSPVLAKSADEGIRAAQQNTFNMVLLDGDIPQQQLRSSVMLIKSTSPVANLPLVVVITSENADSNQSLLSDGCSAVLTKPLDLAILYGVLARLTGQPRQEARIPIKFPVTITEGAPDKQLMCINLSEGGLYLRTHQMLPENTVIHLEFTLPHDTVPINVEAQVARAIPLGMQIDAEPGIGLRFINQPDEIRRRIRNFVQWEMMGDLEWKSTI